MARKSRGKKVRMDLFIELKQRRALEAISEETGAPVAELIRRGIDLLLKQYEQRKQGKERTE